MRHLGAKRLPDEPQSEGAALQSRHHNAERFGGIAHNQMLTGTITK
jgi:hypothetical protein